MSEPNDERLYSVNEVAEILGISSPTVRCYIERGLLVPDRVTHLGKKRRYEVFEFRRETVNAFLQSLARGEYHGEALVSTGDVAQYLNVSLSVVYRYMKAGVLVPDVVLPPARNGKQGRRLFIDKNIRQLAQTHRRKGKKRRRIRYGGVSV